MSASNRVAVAHLGSFDQEALPSLQRAFADQRGIPLLQAWREGFDDHFEPATVWVGWRAESLHVFAELKDRDIFNDAQKLNDKTWLLGDVFEIFLRREAEAGYFELHVTPNNQRLQYKFSGPNQVDHPQALDDPAFFSSRAWITPEKDRWYVHAEIPGRSLGIGAASLVDEKWRFSFSRYDYTRGVEEPVLSSSSAHLEPSFHRVDEWGFFSFQKPDEGAR